MQQSYEIPIIKAFWKRGEKCHAHAHRLTYKKYKPCRQSKRAERYNLGMLFIFWEEQVVKPVQRDNGERKRVLSYDLLVATSIITFAFAWYLMCHVKMEREVL